VAATGRAGRRRAQRRHRTWAANPTQFASLCSKPEGNHWESTLTTSEFHLDMDRVSQVKLDRFRPEAASRSASRRSPRTTISSLLVPPLVRGLGMHSLSKVIRKPGRYVARYYGNRKPIVEPMPWAIQPTTGSWTITSSSRPERSRGRRQQRRRRPIHGRGDWTPVWAKRHVTDPSVPNADVANSVAFREHDRSWAAKSTAGAGMFHRTKQAARPTR